MSGSRLRIRPFFSLILAMCALAAVEDDFRHHQWGAWIEAHCGDNDSILAKSSEAKTRRLWRDTRRPKTSFARSVAPVGVKARKTPPVMCVFPRILCDRGFPQPRSPSMYGGTAESLLCLYARIFLLLFTRLGPSFAVILLVFAMCPDTL